MDHPLPSLAAARPWRTATLVASAVAVVELALLVVLALPLVSRPVAERIEAAGERAVEAAGAVSAAPEAKAHPPASQPEVLRRAETAVLVLNGNGRPGAAGQAGGQIQESGYILAGVGNAPRTDYARTLVLYRPGRRAEAERLATDLGTGVVAPLDGLRPADLLGAHLALILGD
jgi:hypothetical protein